MKASEQMMMPEGLRSHFREAVEKTIKKPKKGDDELLMSLAQSDGWEFLLSIIEKTNKAIDKQTKANVGKARSWEEAGKHYFARDVAVDAVQAIVDIVELRRRAEEADAELNQAKEK